MPSKQKRIKPKPVSFFFPFIKPFYYTTIRGGSLSQLRENEVQDGLIKRIISSRMKGMAFENSDQ